MPTFSIQLRNIELARHQREQITRILRETDNTPTVSSSKTIAGSTPAGDERRLRGIPVVGARGVGGAITGTRPGARL